MLHLNLLIIPDPDAPVALDAYGDETGPGLVVYALNETPGGRAGLLTLVCAYRGAAVSMPSNMLPAFVVSVGYRPLGRLERRERGVKPRPEDFDLAAAVNDLGPRLRALREVTGLRLGDLARALRCSTSQLSRVELGEWKPDPPRTPAQEAMAAKVDATLHPAGRCTCGAGGAGGTCEWCRMDQARAGRRREFAHRLAGIAIGAVLDAFNNTGFLPVPMFREWLQHDGVRELVATALAPHVGSDEREANVAMLAARIADHLLALKFIEPGTGKAVEQSLIFLLAPTSESP